MTNLAVIGVGQWGINWVRALARLSSVKLSGCCDLRPALLDKVRQQFPHVPTTTRLDDVLNDPAIQGVIVATPAPTHFEVARQALLAGKHVLVEKPMTLRSDEAIQLEDLARRQDRLLLPGHLLEFHPSIRCIENMIETGELGDIDYIYCQRLNLGTVRRGENVWWSLAPHDISVACRLLKATPRTIQCRGQSVLQAGIPDVVFATLEFPDGRLTHIHVSWLDPHKTRKITVVGSRKMVVLDDTLPAYKVTVYDKGIDIQQAGPADGREFALREGNIVQPKLDWSEPLLLEAEHFVACINGQRPPLLDARSGSRVVGILEKGQQSLDQGGLAVPVPQPTLVRETLPFPILRIDAESADEAPLPMVDLQQQYRRIKTEVDAALARVVESQQFINGSEVADFEDELASYCGVEHAVGLSSGTDALLAALMALDVGPGDEVITTPYTFFATVGAIVRLGATPVFVDIDPATFNIDPAGIEDRITPRTRAIIPVHLFGQCAEMAPIMKLAERRGLAVIEDAAQAIGAEYQGQRAGSIGTIGCFSFFPAKNLGGFGDGGAIVTRDRALAERIRLLRGHGSNPKYYHRLVGGNFRLDTLQAAVLRVKLRHLDQWTAARQQAAVRYTEGFRSAGLDHCVIPPAVAQERHVFNQYVVRSVYREELRRHLRESRVATEVYYPCPMHLQECFARLGHRPGDFPESERAALTTLALPMHPDLTAEQQQRVVQAAATYYRGTMRRQAA